MPEHSWLEHAKLGDANAIAHLLNQVFSPKGITVRGDRQERNLVLWLESQTPPDQTWVMHTVRKGIMRLQVASMTASIDGVQVHYWHPQNPSYAWSDAISLTDDNPATPETAVAASPPASTTTSPTELSSIARLEQTYQALKADPAASLQAIDEAYAGLKTELLRQGQRTAASQLKATHAQFKSNWQQASLHKQALNSPAETVTAAAIDDTTAAINTLVAAMRSQGLDGQARLHHSQLQIRIDSSTLHPPERAIAILYTLLEKPEFTAFNLQPGEKVAVYGMASPQKIGWKRQIPMPPPATSANRDLTSFDNTHVNTFGLPILLLFGIVMNATPLINFLLRGIKIWFHEFGHATIAWLAGRRAIPLPFGWTNVDPERSLFVYLGLLLLFGLLFWSGKREHKQWAIILAGVLAFLQFCFTWLLPRAQFETLLSFGGIGGELYLCTLLMVSFYFPLPAYWRWDIYRYPMVLGAAFTFWGQFWLWQQIRQGLADIPWGSMWGGAAHGDMNNLSYAGWSDQQIVTTYSTLSNLCLLTLLGIYFYFGIWKNRYYLLALYRKFVSS